MLVFCAEFNYVLGQVDFVMHGSPNHLRVSWQPYELTVDGPSQDASSKDRAFELDRYYFDHFNLAPSKVITDQSFALESFRAEGILEQKQFIVDYPNLFRACAQTSGMAFPKLGLPAQESSRPDVYIMNHANVNAMKYEVSWHVHV